MKTIIFAFLAIISIASCSSDNKTLTQMLVEERNELLFRLSTEADSNQMAIIKEKIAMIEKNILCEEEIQRIATIKGVVDTIWFLDIDGGEIIDPVTGEYFYSFPDEDQSVIILDGKEHKNVEIHQDSVNNVVVIGDSKTQNVKISQEGKNNKIVIGKGNKVSGVTITQE